MAVKKYLANNNVQNNIPRKEQQRSRKLVTISGTMADQEELEDDNDNRGITSIITSNAMLMLVIIIFNSGRNLDFWKSTF